MSNGNKKKPKPKGAGESFYDLDEIRSLIRQGRVRINGDVLEDARTDFGWESDDILAAISKLRSSDFVKKDVLKSNSFVVLDAYRAEVNGERIYTHFYIKDGCPEKSTQDELVINSFKQQ
jgi:hypothetical protein